jgi:nucleoside triphosphate diphosphatase
MSAALGRLLGVMARLRDPDRGCPWDLEQTWASIAPHTIEEAYEVADAVARGSAASVRDELGDLLFQVVFQSRIAEEQGLFGFDDVANSISDKLERRHPHVFGNETITDAAEQARAWERHKTSEREAQGGSGSALGGVALGLPALARAAKLGKRAAGVGFDWPEPLGVLAKVREETAELEQAVASGDTSGVREELGDLLFSVAQFARHCGIDPEAALREAGAKFERRFGAMEARASADGGSLAGLSAAELEALWLTAKQDTG